MYINGPWLINGLKKNNVNFGITAPPKGTVKQQVIMQGCGFAIPSCTTAKEKAAVYKFIEYWNSPEICKEWTMRNGFPPYLNAVINDPEVKADPIQRSIAPLAKLGRPWLSGLQSASMIENDALWPMIESVLTGAEKPADAVKKASNKIDEILKSSK